MIDDQIEVNIAGGLDIPLPQMVKVRVNFEAPRIENVVQAVVEQFKREEIRKKIKPGSSIAVGCGSRGVTNIAAITKAVVSEIKALGGRPFIFPAMGSHGAATAAGQRQVLENYGITEDHAGCPIRSTLETQEIGALDDGTPIHIDQYACDADGIVLINRIKPHTNFRASIESGIVKMMAIGMGKIKGATMLHTHGFGAFGDLMPQAAHFIMNKLPFLFGMGIVENALHETAILKIIPAESLIEEEAGLQRRSKELMGRLLFDMIDVLVIEEIGKDISGAGFDPNITGRNNRFIEWKGPLVKKIVLLNLSAETHGNATGVGLADVITMELYRKMDISATYTNTITSTYLDSASIPLIMNTEQEAIQLAAKTLVGVRPEDCRIVCIKNTRELSEIMVSEPMLAKVRKHPLMEAVTRPGPFNFDSQGNLSFI
ncbi:MAG: DUF2088 domain-containing protein [Deltaproteobacteria bacterium]|nr:DUF2088 domain-containing protein [Deltaproteobacteria bacterium]